MNSILCCTKAHHVWDSADYWTTCIHCGKSKHFLEMIVEIENVRRKNKTMLWKDVPLFEVNGRIIDVAVGLSLGIPEHTLKPTDMVLRYPKGAVVTLIEAGPGFGAGFNIKMQQTGTLETNEVEVRCRQKNIEGEFGVRVMDVNTEESLFEEIGPAGKWVIIRGQLDAPDSGRRVVRWNRGPKK
jgi:hypothetical protein